MLLACGAVKEAGSPRQREVRLVLLSGRGEVFCHRLAVELLDQLVAAPQAVVVVAAAADEVACKITNQEHEKQWIKLSMLYNL